MFLARCTSNVLYAAQSDYMRKVCKTNNATTINILIAFANVGYGRSFGRFNVVGGGGIWEMKLEKDKKKGI